MDIEIIVLSAVISVLFLVFILGPLLYAHSLNSDKINISHKPNSSMYKIICDMESDGVYFPPHVKEQLIQKSEEICNYSGLPSVSSYNNINN